MLQARRTLSGTMDGAPVSDAILSRLYRASPEEIAVIAAGLPRETRAQLAGFCYARAHLRAMGREIARGCDDAALLHFAGGALGACLIEIKRTGVGDGADAASARPARTRVTLASAADMRRRAPPVDLDESESDADASE